MPMNSFDAYLNTTEKPAEIAARLAISQQHVSFLRRGIRRPSLELALKIEAATKGQVTVKSWFEGEHAL